MRKRTDRERSIFGDAMSYSRWSNSCWYTYWLATNSKVREEQEFDICGFTTISYEDVDELGFDKTIEMLKDRFASMKKSNKSNTLFLGKKYTEEEWQELKGYIQEWYDEVKEQFNTPSQKYRDGKITLEQAFVEEI
jgi:hypothetical protein